MNLRKMSTKAYARYCGIASSATLMLANTATAFAAPEVGTSKLQEFIDSFIVPWLTLIGGVVAMVGGVMFALSWQREDAEGKSKGLMTIMAGFMIVGISQATNIFM